MYTRLLTLSSLLLTVFAAEASSFGPTMFLDKLSLLKNSSEVIFKSQNEDDEPILIEPLRFGKARVQVNAEYWSLSDQSISVNTMVLCEFEMETPIFDFSGRDFKNGVRFETGNKSCSGQLQKSGLVEVGILVYMILEPEDFLDASAPIAKKRFAANTYFKKHDFILDPSRFAVSSASTKDVGLTNLSVETSPIRALTEVGGPELPTYVEQIRTVIEFIDEPAMQRTK